MKIGFVGDLHLGIKSDSSDFHENHVAFINWMIEQFIANGVTTIIFFGDIFHNRNEINVKTLNIAHWAIEKLSKTFGLDLLKGNHDIYYKNTTTVSSLNSFKELKNVTIIDEPFIRTYENKRFLLIPWVINERSLYKWLRKQNEVYDQICGHFEFKGGQMTQTYTMTTGGMNHRQIEKWSKGKVFSGHFHLKRHFNKKIFYIGSPLQLTWADSGEEKSIYVFDTKDDSLTEINNDISSKFYKLFLSKLKNDKSIINNIPNNFIKFFIDLPTSELKLQQLIDVIRARGPASFQISDISLDLYTNGIDDIQLNLQDPWSFVEKYLESLTVPDEINLEILKKRLSDIYHEALTI